LEVVQISAVIDV